METNIHWSNDLSPLTLNWRCPFCNVGRLELLNNNLLIQEYEHSKNNHKHAAFEAAWLESSCAGILICSNNFCKEHVSFCGSSRGEELEDFEVYKPENPYGCDREYRDVITPLLIYPSPHFIEISTKYPEQVIIHLKESRYYF